MRTRTFRREQYVLLGKLSLASEEAKLRDAFRPAWPDWLLSALAALCTSAAVVFVHGANLCSIQRAILMCILVCIAREDIRAFRIPNALIVAGLAVRVVFLVVQAVTDSQASIASIAGSVSSSPAMPFAMVAESAASAAFLPEVVKTGAKLFAVSLLNALGFSGVPLFIAIVLERLLGKPVLGGGDVKLLFMAGAYFSPFENTLAIIVACAVSLATVFVRWFARKSRENVVAFGAALAVGFWVAMLVPIA